MPFPFVAAGDDGKVMCVGQACGSGPNTGKNLRAAARIGGPFSDIYLVAGDDGAIFGHLGGTWKHLNGNGTTKNLNGMSFAGNTRIGWIVGDDGLILKTTDGGESWGAQNSQTSYNLKGVSAVDANTVWVVGDSGEVRITKDGGANWIRSDSVDAITSAGLKAISAIDGNRATAVGDDGTVLTTLNGGASWVYLHVTGTFGLASFGDDLHGVVMREDSTWVAMDNGHVAIRGADPHADFQVNTQTGTSKSLYGIEVRTVYTIVVLSWNPFLIKPVIHTEAILVGDDGAILFTDDFGATWMLFTHPSTTKNLRAVT